MDTPIRYGEQCFHLYLEHILFILFHFQQKSVENAILVHSILTFIISKMLKSLTFTLLFTVLLNTLTIAQISTPAPSPSAKTVQTVGLTELEVHYSRPSKKGRTIFGDDALVPYGKIWRTGANAATKISFDDAVTFDGKTLEAGAYAILTKPDASEWAIHFYTYESGNWGSYTEKTPVAIVMAKSSKVSESIESFCIGFDHIGMDAAHLVFAWDNTKVAVPFQVEVKKKVMANIENVMAGPSANDYFRAASFIHESGGDLKKALEYVQKATKSENARFFHVRREALILADMGKKKEAVATAKRSLELSKAAKNEDYVRLNEKSIKEWSK